MFYWMPGDGEHSGQGTARGHFLASSSLERVLMISSFLACSRSSRRFRASLVLERRASELLAGFVRLQLVDVLHEDPLVLEHVALDLQAGSTHMWRSRRRIRIRRIHVTFSGMRALAHSPMPMCRPFRRASVFFLQRARECTLPDLLPPRTGVGVGDLVGLIGIQPHLLLPAAQDAGGQPLLEPEHTGRGMGTRSGEAAPTAGALQLPQGTLALLRALHHPVQRAPHPPQGPCNPPRGLCHPPHGTLHPPLRDRHPPRGARTPLGGTSPPSRDPHPPLRVPLRRPPHPAQDVASPSGDPQHPPGPLKDPHPALKSAARAPRTPRAAPRGASKDRSARDERAHPAQRSLHSRRTPRPPSRPLGPSARPSRLLRHFPTRPEEATAASQRPGPPRSTAGSQPRLLSHPPVPSGPSRCLPTAVIPQNSGYSPAPTSWRRRRGLRDAAAALTPPSARGTYHPALPPAPVPAAPGPPGTL
uniref:Uncharacterized protein n=1 Tax=Corvus moneduloides TaxID=1196302 RepID=A0A8U7NA80_CORMO